MEPLHFRSLKIIKRIQKNRNMQIQIIPIFHFIHVTAARRADVRSDEVFRKCRKPETDFKYPN